MIIAPRLIARWAPPWTLALTLALLAASAARAEETEESPGDTQPAPWRAGASVTALAGRDSNVFLAEGSRHRDHLSEAQVETTIESDLGAFGEAYAQAEGRERRYFDEQRANERAGSLYAEWTRPCDDPSAAFTLDALITRQSARLFDAQGSLAPRGRWAALEHTAHAQAAYSDWDPFSIELGGGFLRANLRESAGQESLDHRDRLLDGAWRWQPDAIASLGLSGQWTSRRYDQRRRRDRDGAALSPGRPLRLELPALSLEARAEALTDLVFTGALTGRKAADNGAGYFDFEEWGLHAGVEYQVAAGSRVELDGSWRHRRYPRRRLLTRPGHERESLADGTLAVSRVAWPQWTPDLEVVLSLSWFGLHAREEQQSHRRMVIFLGLRYRWRSSPSVPLD